MTRTTDWQYDRLREALTAGKNQHEMVERYHTNTEFKRGIDTLAAVLPIFVELLAKHADEQAARMEAAIREAQAMPPLPTFTPKARLATEDDQ